MKITKTKEASKLIPQSRNPEVVYFWLYISAHTSGTTVGTWDISVWVGGGLSQRGPHQQIWLHQTK